MIGTVNDSVQTHTKCNKPWRHIKKQRRNATIRSEMKKSLALIRKTLAECFIPERNPIFHSNCIKNGGGMQYSRAECNLTWFLAFRCEQLQNQTSIAQYF